MSVFPQVYTFSEVKRLVFQAQDKFPGCRPGQAVVNFFQVPKEVEDAIYEMRDKEKVWKYMFDKYRSDNV